MEEVPKSSERMRRRDVISVLRGQLRGSQIYDAKCVYATTESRTYRQKLFSLRFNPLSLGNDDTRIFYFPFFAFAPLKKRLCSLSIGNHNKTINVTQSHAAESIFASTSTKPLFTGTTIWVWLASIQFVQINEKERNENEKPYIWMHCKRHQRSPAE